MASVKKPADGDTSHQSSSCWPADYSFAIRRRPFAGSSTFGLPGGLQSALSSTGSSFDWQRCADSECYHTMVAHACPLKHL